MMTKRLYPFMLACAIAFCLSASCESNPAGPDDPSGENGSGSDITGGDIEVVDGKVTFFVTFDPEGPHAAAGKPSRGTKVIVNGKEYAVTKDSQGRQTVTVAASSSGSYNCALVNTLSKKYYGTSPNLEVKLPFSQFADGTEALLQDYPMYASYTQETGSILAFKDGFAMIDLNLKGDASITSVKAVNPAGGNMGGIGNFIPKSSSISLSKGLPFAVLNCTCKGENSPLSSSGRHFYIIIAPGNYAQGIELTICDSSHKMMKHTISAATVKANQVIKEELEYKPDADLVFYEGFDNMVWGGDYAGGAASLGFAPTADKMDTDSGKELTGYEEAYTAVSYDSPGTGFLQSNTWADVSGKTFSTSHQMSESYIKSRALWDYTYGFRCQEYQGCIAVGTATNARGIFMNYGVNTDAAIYSARLSFDVCPKYGFDDDLLCEVINGGYVTSVKIDGKSVSLDKEHKYYSSNSSMVIIGRSMLKMPVSADAAKSWTHIELEMERATNGTSLYIAGNTSASGNHGIFLDNIEMRRTSDMERPSNTLRVLYWNVQNGMWADQHNNYDNFVEFVKRYDPDVCVWCESATIYKDRTSTGIGNSGSTYKGFLPAGWSTLAARYGHRYAAVGGARDNFPQTITSKYPITTLLKITNGETSSKPIAHGAAIQQITVGGKPINIVTLHTWPQAYGFGVSSANQEASAAMHEGDYYREYEMKYILDHTILASLYSGKQDWLMMGDFNSRSRLDNWFYKYDDNDTKLLCQDQVLNRTDMVDIIAKRYSGEFMSSTYGNARIDYMFASPSMYARVNNAMILIDKWTTAHQSTYVTSFYEPSDHRPILVDFNF